MTITSVILHLCLQVASQCVTVYACKQVLSCKHIHPVVRKSTAIFLLSRHMVATDLWMCSLFWCMYSWVLCSCAKGVCSIFQ